MATIAPPKVRDQVTTPDKDHFELCGEACVASALDHSVEEVTTWIRNRFGEGAVQHGTTAQVLIAYIANQGVGASIALGPAATYVADAVGRQHYALVLCWSTPAGVPTSKRGIGHWILGYGSDGRKVSVMNPFGGKITAYDLSQGQDQQYGIEVWKVQGAPPAKTPTKLPPPKPTQAPPRSPGGTVYIVVRGDTLSGIAKKYGLSLQAILAANPQIKDRNKISIGQQIVIPNGRVGAPAGKAPSAPRQSKPAPAPSAKPAATRVHVVVRGDTLSAIAKKYGVSLQAILKANPQIKDKNKIQVGWRISIPK